MTCIIGYIDNDNKKVYMGADSCASNGFKKETRKDRKIFKPENNKNFLISFTTSFRMGQLLMYSNIFPTEDEIQKNNMKIDHKYITTILIPRIQNLFKEGGFGTDDEGGIFLIAYKNKLFKIESDFQVSEFLSEFVCGGSGEYHANGCLYGLQYNSDISITNKIHKALQCASEYCLGVEKPFYIMNTSDSEIIRYDK